RDRRHPGRRLRRRQPGLPPPPDPGRGRDLEPRGDRLDARASQSRLGARHHSRRRARSHRRRRRGVPPRRRRVQVRPPTDRPRPQRRPGRHRRVSAVATPRRVDETRPRPRATFADRLLAAAPLASIYLWLSIIYCFEAWKRITPWLFTDELEMTQI